MKAFSKIFRATTFTVWYVPRLNFSKMYLCNVFVYNSYIWGQYLCTFSCMHAFICLHIINYLSRYHPCVISTHGLVISVTYSYCVSGSIYSTTYLYLDCIWKITIFEADTPVYPKWVFVLYDVMVSIWHGGVTYLVCR